MQTTQLSAAQLMGEFLGSETGKISRKLASGEFSDELNAQQMSVLGGASAAVLKGSESSQAANLLQAAGLAVQANSLGGAGVLGAQEAGIGKTALSQLSIPSENQNNPLLGTAADSLESAQKTVAEAASGKADRSPLPRQAHRVNQWTAQGQKAALAQQALQAAANGVEEGVRGPAVKAKAASEETNGEDIVYVDALLVERIATQFKLPAEQRDTIQAAADSSGRVPLKDLCKILNDPGNQQATQIAPARVASVDIQQLIGSLQQGKAEATPAATAELQMKSKGAYNLGEFKGLLNHISSQVDQEQQAKKAGNLIGLTSSADDGAANASHQSVEAAKKAATLQRPTHNLVPSFSADNGTSQQPAGMASLFEDSAGGDLSRGIALSPGQQVDTKAPAGSVTENVSLHHEQKEPVQKLTGDANISDENASYDRPLRSGTGQELNGKSGGRSDDLYSGKRGALQESLSLHQQAGTGSSDGEKTGFAPILRPDMQTGNVHFGSDRASQASVPGYLSVNEPGWTEKLAQRMQGMDGQDRSYLTLELEPKELGKLSVRVETHNNQVTASIVADNERARSLLMQNSTSLQNSLQEQGLVLGRIAVDLRQESSDQQASRDLQRNGRKRRTETTPVSAATAGIPTAAQIQPSRSADQIISLFT